MEFRGIMGGFYKLSEWIMRLSVINVLWVVCSFPFFFFLLAALASPVVAQSGGNIEMAIRQTLFLLALVMPFTLIPATAAVYTVARKWVIGDVDVPLVKTFFRGYKENYLQSMFGAFIFQLIGIILYVNYQWYSSSAGYLKFFSYVFIVLLFFLVAAFLNFLSIMVHMHMKFWPMVRNSLLLTIGNPIISVAILAVNGFLIYIVINYPVLSFLIPFFLGSLMATATFWLFYQSFQRLQDKVEKMRQSKEKEEN